MVIIALMGAGLKIDRVFGLHRWQMTWRLTMEIGPVIVLRVPGDVAVEHAAALARALREEA